MSGLELIMCIHLGVTIGSFGFLPFAAILLFYEVFIAQDGACFHPEAFTEVDLVASVLAIFSGVWVLMGAVAIVWNCYTRKVKW